jgi:DDE superfamily endonuclease
LLAYGANAFLKNDYRGLMNDPDRDVPRFFPPDLIIHIKAIACELPAIHRVPISRWNTSDLGREVRQSGVVATISDSTIWRWLHEDALRPWQHRSWIFPRDPQFAVKAGRILDLYERVWEGSPLKKDEFVLSADEKTSIQARHRRHCTYPSQPGIAMKVEHEYKRCGAWTYIAALDVHRAKLFGRCERKNGIAPFDRLVAEVMNKSPYIKARRVFWIVDNGSAHRGARAVERLQSRYSNLVLVHAPVHASWLNQIEIYFSILQRKALTPNDFTSLKELEERLLCFQDYYEQIATPFEWKFTREDLNILLNKITTTIFNKQAA